MQPSLSKEAWAVIAGGVVVGRKLKFDDAAKLANAHKKKTGVSACVITDAAAARAEKGKTK